MDMENSDEEPLNESFIDILEFKKEFNPLDFARSLLPASKLSENDETESTFYGEFLDDLETKIANDEISPLKTNYYESLRTWTNVRFKKKKSVDVKKEFHSIPEEENNVIPQSEVNSHEFSEVGDLNISDTLSKFLEDDNKSAVQISNLNLESYSVDLTLIKSASSGKKVFRFYYLDAHEKLFGEDSAVHLFGKTYCPIYKSYKSCCVVVRPLKRRLFVIPRAELGQNNKSYEMRILKEFYKLALKPLNITKFKFKFAKRRNLEGLFSEEQLMLEIEYSANYPTVNPKLDGETFSKVFGANNNCFENFLLEKQIKGPCWLNVINPNKVVKAKTWCFFELSCTPEEISVCKSITKSVSPPLTLLSYHIRTVDEINRVVLITWAVNFNYQIWTENLNIMEEKSYCSFAIVSSNEEQLELPELLKNLKRIKIQNMSSEKELLLHFLDEFQKIDPDILVGYDIQNDEFHKFIDRLVSLKIKDLSKLSKFRFCKGNSDSKKFLFDGRLLCDLKHLAKEFTLAKNYELNELLENFIGVRKEDRRIVDFGEIISPTGSFQDIVNQEEKFLKIFVTATNEPLYLLKLVSKTNIIPLSIKLTEICGNTLSQTFSGGISKRNEYLLLHAFHEENFIVPNKMFTKKPKDADDELLAGGLVLEPKIGFYNNYILLMDFQSLYPSIIHEFNLCISHDNFFNSDSTQMPIGVLPKLMKYLIEKRNGVKNEMKTLDQNSPAYSRCQIYQTALKLSANGIYGCLAHQYFRFYCPSVAKDITRRAREILSNSVRLLERNGFEIIYGDTDSMMVNTKTTDLICAKEMGQEIRKIVNAQFSSVNLKIDSIFEKLLIIAKKKYAGIAVNMQNADSKGERILKGLDIVRYDWPVYVCEVGKIIVDVILSNSSTEEKKRLIQEKLGEVKKKLLNNEVPEKLLVITKYLTQDPKEYPKNTGQPHVQVAIRCNENSLFKFKSGDAVSFLMCYDKSKAISQMAYHLEELKHSNDLTIDGSYYLEKQVYPFVSKICVHIGLNIEDIEQSLSLKKNTKPERFDENEIEFERRDPFIFDCLKCGRQNKFDENDNTGSLHKCQNDECDFCPLENLSYLKNRLVITLIAYIEKYYKYQMRCNELKCSYMTSRIPLRSTKEHNICPRCGGGRMLQIYNESDLFLQFQYFKYLLKDGLNSTSHEEEKAAIRCLLQVLYNYEKHSGFLSVNLTDLFTSL